MVVTAASPGRVLFWATLGTLLIFVAYALWQMPQSHATASAIGERAGEVAGAVWDRLLRAAGAR